MIMIKMVEILTKGKQPSGYCGHWLLSGHSYKKRVWLRHCSAPNAHVSDI